MGNVATATTGSAISDLLNKTIISSSTGSPLLTVEHLVAIGVGAGIIYFMIPERKRKNLFN